MKFVTVATHSENYFPTLINSLKYAAVSYQVLGFGQKWTGFRMKFDLMIFWLSKQTPNDVVMFLDGFDSFFYGNADELEAKFRQSKKGIIFSKNKCSLGFLCPLLQPYIDRKIYRSDSETHINTGLYIGYAGNLLAYLIKLRPLCSSTDDERCVNENRHLFKEFDVHIDTNEEFFKNGPTGKESLTCYGYQFPGGMRIPKNITDLLPFKITRKKGGLIKRIKRSLGEYFQFVFPEIILVLLIIIIAVYFWGYFKLRGKKLRKKA